MVIRPILPFQSSPVSNCSSRVELKLRDNSYFIFHFIKLLSDNSRRVPRLNCGKQILPLLLSIRKRFFLHTTKASSKRIGQYSSDYKWKRERFQCQNLVPCLQILHSFADICLEKLETHNQALNFKLDAFCFAVSYLSSVFILTSFFLYSCPLCLWEVHPGFSAVFVTSGTQPQQPSAVISRDGAEQQVQMKKIHFLVQGQ